MWVDAKIQGPMILTPLRDYIIFFLMFATKFIRNLLMKSVYILIFTH